MQIIGALLAGGEARRLSGIHKPLLQIGGRSMARRILDQIEPHVSNVLISANEVEPYRVFGHSVVCDGRADRLGPLGGLAALHDHALETFGPEIEILTVPADTPFLPNDLVSRLALPMDEATVRVASFGGRWQPTIALWPLRFLQGLPAHLDAGGPRALRAWIERWPYVAVPFEPDPLAPQNDPFFNVNTPAELDFARQHAKTLESP